MSLKSMVLAFKKVVQVVQIRGGGGVIWTKSKRKAVFLRSASLIYKSGTMPEDEICVLADSAALRERVVPPFELASKRTWEA